MVDLLLDRNRNKDLTFHDQADIEHNSWSERSFLAILNIACGLLLLAIRLDENFAYYYVCIHALQFVGNMGAVLILCRKLVPKYFTAINIFGAQLSLAASAITLFEGFGESPAHWSNILTFVFAGACFYFLFGRIFRPWFLNLWSRVVPSWKGGHLHQWIMCPMVLPDHNFCSILGSRCCCRHSAIHFCELWYIRYLCFLVQLHSLRNHR